jgi:DNA polymerase III epsilon subunit-like protein
MFDMQAILGACDLSGIAAPDMESIDTQALSQAMLSLPRFRLPDVAESLGLPPFTHHNAEDDAKACAGILVELARPHGSIDGLLTAAMVMKNTVRAGNRAAGGSVQLPRWVVENIRTIPYVSPSHNAWIDQVLAHPDGRATEGTPCILCGTPIDKKTNYKYKDRHCCPGCSGKLKRRALKFLQSQTAR